MGNHGAASAEPRAGAADKGARQSTAFGVPSSWTLRLQNLPVSWRLIAVIVLALVMGLVFGGLRVAAAAGSAAQFGRVSQLANLGEQTTVLVQDLQNERDKTLGVIAGGNLNDLKPLYNATDAQAATVQAQAAGIGGSFPANIQASVATVLSQTSAKGLSTLRDTAQGQGSDVLGVIADYATPIGDMITLNDEIAQGTSDSSLANDVRTLNSLALAKDAAAQQRALLYNAFTQQFFGDGVVQALTAVQSEEFADEAAFESTATPAERSAFANTVNGPGVNNAEVIEDFFFIDGGDQQAAEHIHNQSLDHWLHPGPGAYRLVFGDVRQARRDADRRKADSREHRLTRAVAAAGRAAVRADHRHHHRDRAVRRPGRGGAGRQVPGPAAAQAAGRGA